MWEMDFCRGGASEERFNWGRNSRSEGGVAQGWGKWMNPERHQGPQEGPSLELRSEAQEAGQRPQRWS